MNDEYPVIQYFISWRLSDMKPYGRVEVWLHAFLILALDRDYCLVSRSGNLRKLNSKSNNAQDAAKSFCLNK